MNIRKQTFGVDFPFKDSNNGDLVKLTDTPESEIKADLIHLLLTKKGSRYFLPEFGTNLNQYIFDQMDEALTIKIENEITEAVERYIPNIIINKIIITRLNEDIDLVNDNKAQHTLKINIDYTVSSRSFQSSDFR